MKNYGWNEGTLLVNGVQITGGGKGDDVLTVAYREDGFTGTVGVDGEEYVAKSANESGTFTFRLMQGADSNGFLMDVDNTARNAAFVPLTVMWQCLDGERAIGDQGYIVKPGDLVRGVGFNEHEWVINVQKLVMILPGSTLAV